jgi:hypothetical protein
MTVSVSSMQKRCPDTAAHLATCPLRVDTAHLADDRFRVWYASHHATGFATRACAAAGGASRDAVGQLTPALLLRQEGGHGTWAKVASLWRCKFAVGRFPGSSVYAAVTSVGSE